MAPSIVHLPNGQNLTVTPVFGGLYFKSNELNTHNTSFPPGWTIVLNEAEDEADEDDSSSLTSSAGTDFSDPRPSRRLHIHRYKRPTLRNDHLFISSISNPNSSEFRPASSPTRQLAMMLWATLWWYFHQPEPDSRLETDESSDTAAAGKPKGEWRININREGIFKGKNVLPKLERMGLIATEDSSVGTATDEKISFGWKRMFVSRRAFWQIDARIYLFTLLPVNSSPFPSSSPYPSRPSSPKRDGLKDSSDKLDRLEALSESLSKSGPLTPPHLFQSNSHLPTFYPPHPPQYVFTDGVRHPLRPKPFRQGETFYTRYVPSVNQYLSFRVASLSTKACVYHGPVSKASVSTLADIRSPQSSLSDSVLPTMGNLSIGPTDLELLNTWMNDPRVAKTWGEDGPQEHQEKFLRQNLSNRHSIPVIGCWDGKPFGYFEIYWVKEDQLGTLIPGEVSDWDRGIRCLVGEQEFRGPNRVAIWLSALVHYCWLADLRTSAVFAEPRVDNTKMENYLYEAGFHKEKEVAFPHKQANLMKISRDSWEKPAI